jgi:predicted dinucleotide-binding enzyme
LPALRHLAVVFAAWRRRLARRLTAAGIRPRQQGRWVSPTLDFSKGMPPTIFTPQGDSLAESIQRKFPEARVVKALNTVNANVMVSPGKVPGESDIFVCGNDAAAKQRVVELLHAFGWKNVIDLGDITGARGLEAYLLLWLRLWGVVGKPEFNIRIVR